jgi:hypothetical protein
MVETYKEAEQGFIYKQYLNNVGLNILHPTDAILSNNLKVKYVHLGSGLNKQQKDGSIKNRNSFTLEMENYINNFNKANLGARDYNFNFDPK